MKSTIPLLVILAATASAQPPNRARAESLVHRALNVIGGSEMLNRVQIIQTDERRLLFHIQEADRWEPPFIPDYVDAKQWVDFPSRALRYEITVAAASGDKRTSILIAHDGYAVSRSSFNGNTSGNTFGLEPSRWQLQDPVLVLLRALESSDLHQLPPETLLHDEHQRVSFTDRQCRVMLWIDPRNDHLDAVDVLGTDARDMFWNEWGDVDLRVVYSFWQFEGGGLHYPHQWDIYFNGALQETRSIVQLAVNPDMRNTDMTVPAEARQAQPRPPVDDFTFGRSDRPNVEIFPGVVQIPGNWYVTFIRQPDGIVVIDAPISNGYSRKVLQEISKRYPGEKVKALATTTSFWWHIAGVREYAARGVPIYAIDGNAPLIQKLLNAPHTIAPDALQQQKSKPKVIAVKENFSLGHGPNRIVLCPIRQATTQMLMVWMPEHKLLHTAEMVQPLGPNGSFLFPESLLELRRSVEADHLPVENMIGMHMSLTPWKLLVETLAKVSRGDGSL